MIARAAALFLVLSGASAADAWESGTPAEHAELWRQAWVAAGLPPIDGPPAAPVTLQVFTDATGKRPVSFAEAEQIAARPIDLGAFAGLPDFSYAIWDWVTGNSECPLDGAGVGPTDPAVCHEFESHMGAANSNHFVPQAQWTYEHYHRLALEIAARCATMATAVAGRPEFLEYVRECEVEALAFEAFGQHFLQDAWAAGHMWERWGAPDRRSGVPLLGSIVVAMTAGLIHGVGPLAEDIPLLKLIASSWDDPLSGQQYDLFSRHPLVEWTGPAHPQPQPGVGDRGLLTVLGGGAAYAAQREQLLRCAAAGLREVYGATAEVHGPLPAGVSPVDPTSEACFGQRVTNAALWVGFGIHFTDHNLQAVGRPVDPAEAAEVIVRFASGRTGALSCDADDAACAELIQHYRAGLVNVASELEARLAECADCTDLADGGLPPLLKVQSNGVYDKPKVAEYADSLSRLTGTDRGLAVARAFHRSHAAEWCEATTEADLTTLRERVWRSQGESDAGTRLAACTTLAMRHLRRQPIAPAVGSPAPSLCDLVQPGSAAIEIEADTTPPLEELARQWCKCRSSNLRNCRCEIPLPFRPYAINDHGTVIGTLPDGERTDLVVWDGSLHRIPFDEEVVSADINNHGVFVVTSDGNAYPIYRPYVGTLSGGIAALPVPENTCEPTFSYPGPDNTGSAAVVEISDSGMIRGSAVFEITVSGTLPYPMCGIEDPCSDRCSSACVTSATWCDANELPARTRPVLWIDGQLVDPTGFPMSYPFDSVVSTSPRFTFNSRYHTVPDGEYIASLAGLNDEGQAVGHRWSVRDGRVAEHVPIVWRGDVESVGTPGDVYLDINDLGHIIGYRGDTVMIWRDGTATSVGPAGPYAYRINNFDEVVALSGTDLFGRGKIDANNVGQVLVSDGIDNTGRIVTPSICGG